MYSLINKKNTNNLVADYRFISIWLIIFATANHISDQTYLLRIISLLLGGFFSVIIILNFIKDNRLQRQPLIISLLIFCFLIFYALLIPSIYANQLIIERNIFFLIFFMFMLILTLNKNDFVTEKSFKFIAYISLIIFIVHTLVGSFDLSNGFRFNISRLDVSYLQRISYFYGFSSIISFGLFYGSKNVFLRLLLLIMTLIFMVLCLAGGGRGEVLALFASFFSIALVQKRYLQVGVGIFLSILLIIIFFEELSEIFFVIGRFERIVSDGSNVRLDLYYSSIQMLIDNPQCLIFGCGFGYYETFSEVGAGRYPHNILLDFLLSIGIVFSFIFFYFYIKTLSILRKNILFKSSQTINSIIFGLLIFTLAIAMKSRSGLSNIELFFLMIIVLYPYYIILGNKLIK